MSFKKNIIDLYGQRGQNWLDNLPEFYKKSAIKWNLFDLKPFENLSYNYVLGGKRDGSSIILKLACDKNELQQEINALIHFDGHGSVKLLGYDLELGAILLERLLPGEDLKSMFSAQEKESIEITCKVIRKLHSASRENLKNFKNISDWLVALNRDWNLPLNHLKKARELSEYLLATSAEQVLLHGDLHHENILSSGKNEWVAIDPKGIVGEPVYEVGAFIRNPMPELLEAPNVLQIIQKRIEYFAKNLNFDAQRIYQWVYVQSILGACWSLDGNQDPSYFIELANIIEKH
ncbi:MAG: hypothetical protein UR26_C0002G0149 [candidate division TM6 bacterium GW2011_GWF2_32_72]|nr:MAG: hypothetical protein UR26_C0002G0149 [candidate division TM6 bacterium GW2011_GWF2_32_72]